jgi:hypothetical protein
VVLKVVLKARGQIVMCLMVVDEEVLRRVRVWEIVWPF